jgi:hypothetical protein
MAVPLAPLPRVRVRLFKTDEGVKAFVTGAASPDVVEGIRGFLGSSMARVCVVENVQLDVEWV